MTVQTSLDPTAIELDRRNSKPAWLSSGVAYNSGVAALRTALALSIVAAAAGLRLVPSAAADQPAWDQWQHVVGIVDVAWSRKRERVERIQQISQQKASELEALDRDFKLVLREVE